MLVTCRGGSGSVQVPDTDVRRSVVLTSASEMWQPGEGPLTLSDVHISDLRLWLTGSHEHQPMDLDQALRCLGVACRLNADCARWASGVHLLRQHIACSVSVHCTFSAIQVQSVIDRACVQTSWR